MMIGYENEEVQGLLKEIEGMAANTWREFSIELRDKMLKIIEELCDIIYRSSVEGEEVFVGFDDDVEALLDQLTQTSIKQLQVISIAGMDGIGKTTLSRKLYNDALIQYHFDIRAWTCVSQTYIKRDLLIGILSSFIYDLKEEIYKMSDEQLGEKLYRLLKGQKYLVVLDDIWDCKAWNDLQIYFPDDKVGSQVLLTSRDIDVSLHVRAARPAHILRLRTANESWNIFQKKLGKILEEGALVLSEAYKSLRILDVESIHMSLFPSLVMQLGNLRYLAIQAHDGSPQASISKLVNLQMLIILSRKNVALPKTISHLVNLRHLCIKSGENLIEEPYSIQVSTKNDELGSLQTLSQISPKSCQNLFSRTPNLKNLGLCGPLISYQGDLEFPSTNSLKKLQKLKLLNTVTYRGPTRSCNPIMFPEMLKQLTLSNIGMEWEEMWSFSLLPNLEVLKLKFNACIGERWETGDA
ncbi:hypothetical protein LXL04_017316 [Taraxacum kok-saghyz]